MPKLDIQPENIDRLIGVDFERAEPGAWWDTNDWNGQECHENKISFIDDLQQLVGGLIAQEEVIYLLSPEVSAITFFNTLADRASDFGYYVYNSDNFFELYDADLVEDEYSAEELAEMLEEDAATPSPFSLH
ncbi:MAG: hypothetical protein CTY35_00665 [Methylotenera sp.]|uniref:hypothetical protein n=1 Tax=Methylotenera sp. TaxID=2051956 RepID=UPI000D48DC44|nr:hypothetical protein [Methylotenera sp.]PPC84866.1 MAG: hypothetical protein CTY38_00660 [Methylotenera sp.]PPD02226.1 MAG: hypothetical protein CTY35_00665 [Methylotenera sp.]